MDDLGNELTLITGSQLPGIVYQNTKSNPLINYEHTTKKER